MNELINWNCTNCNQRTPQIKLIYPFIKLLQPREYKEKQENLIIFGQTRSQTIVISSTIFSVE